jgi:hypothetical protein
MAALWQVQIGTDTGLSLLALIALMSICALSTSHIPIAIGAFLGNIELSSVIGPRRTSRGRLFLVQRRPKGSTLAHPASFEGKGRAWSRISAAVKAALLMTSWSCRRCFIDAYSLLLSETRQRCFHIRVPSYRTAIKTSDSSMTS